MSQTFMRSLAMLWWPLDYPSGPRPVLEGVQQPAPGGCLYGAGGPALRRRREPSRPEHQQTGQPTSVRITGRDGMVLAAPPAR